MCAKLFFFRGRRQWPQAISDRFPCFCYSATVLPTPHTLDGVGGSEMACGHCRRPRKKKQLGTPLSSPCGIPRRFSYVPPENLAPQLSSPWLHPARFSCVLVSAPLPDDGFSPLPRQPVLSISLTFTPINSQVCVLGSPSGPFRQRHHHHRLSPRPRRLVFFITFTLHQ